MYSKMNSKSDTELPIITNVTNAQNCVHYDSIRSPSYIVNKRSSIVYLQVAVDDNAPASVGEFLLAIYNIDSKELIIPRILSQ